MEPSQKTTQPAPWALGIIDTFRQIAQFLGIPKSVGEIFGILYCSEPALASDQIGEQLGLSKAAVSKGLDYLKRYNAVQSSYILGDRREHFTAETDLSKIVNGFLTAQVERDMKSWRERVEFGQAILPTADASILGKTDKQFVLSKLENLATWQKQFELTLPLLRGHFGTAEKLGDRS